MPHTEFRLLSVTDPRLAAHAASPLPAWLWSADGAHVLWANAAGTAAFAALAGEPLTERTFGPADQHRRQVAQLAGRLLPTGALRLERLRGFGAPLAGLVTCACARLDFADGRMAILVATAEPVGRELPLAERLRHLIDGIDLPAAAFAGDGTLIGTNAAARSLFGFANLAGAGLQDAGRAAIRDGRAKTDIEAGGVVLQRVGAGVDPALIALITPASRRHVSSAMTDSDRPAPAQTNTPPEPPATDATFPAAAAEIAPNSVLFDALDQTAGPASADQPPYAPGENGASHSTAESVTAHPAPQLPSSRDEPPAPAQHPLRFLWHMDAGGRFSLDSDEFTRIIGPRTAAAFGRPWDEIVASFDLDPEGLVARAVATRETWTGIMLNWPVDDPGERLPVELSGLPVFDRERSFAGYRGFGVCRDLAALTRLAAERHMNAAEPHPPPRPLHADVPNERPDAHHGAPVAAESPLPADPDAFVDSSQNVVPFRPATDTRSPTLTPVENSAFNELARQLSARLEQEHGASPAQDDSHDPAAAPIDQSGPADASDDGAQAIAEPPQIPASGETAPDTTVLDVVPAGVLIYRAPQLLYANRAFLDHVGHASLDALHDAGGLDALNVRSEAADDSLAADAAAALTLTPQRSSAAEPSPLRARRFTIAWGGEPAHALILSAPPAPEPAATPSPPGQAKAEELAAILDTTADGVVMFDGAGRISTCNRSAEALFGYDGDDLIKRDLADLFAPESQTVARDYLERIRSAGAASLLDHGRDVLGRVRGGGFIPLSMTMGRPGPDSANFFAVFRDLSQSRQSEAELLQARRKVERAGTAKADVLARVSHEIRTPLNAILGFAEVMIEERFGALGNERYTEYLKDIRASGQRVIAIIDEMLDLSQVETGKLELAFASQNLNDLVEQCVAVMQPQANRERIIIRTSLAHTLPTVIADARALRQITLNMIGSSIRLANSGGQVIVSTAVSDLGDVMLRVRDTGHGLNERELAAALDPLGSPTSEQTPGRIGVNLSLTKALVEANRARFQIKSAPQSGTLIEVSFAPAGARA